MGGSTKHKFFQRIYLLPIYFNILICFFAIASLLPSSAQASGIPRNTVQYTLIYSDDIETAASQLGSAFSLGPAGSFTSATAEVIAGTASIKGSYSGSGTFSSYLTTSPSALPLTAGQTYQITFQYKILTAPSKGFEVLFLSNTAAAAGNFLASTVITGAAGTTGTATLTNTLGNYSDYQAIWNIQGTGAIAIDNIQITNQTTGKVIATENAEKTGPNASSGLQLINGASITTDPAQVIAGGGSVLLCNGAQLSTNSATLPLAANTTYVTDFSYKILNTTDKNPMFFWFQPVGDTNSNNRVSGRAMLQNQTASGTYSVGALTSSASNYVFTLASGQNTCVVVDTIRMYRQDTTVSTSVPAQWSALENLPFPRLGRYQLGTVENIPFGVAEGVQFTYNLDQVEFGLAFNDLLVGVDVDNQALSPGSIHRLRQLNPNMVILPYRISEEQQENLISPSDKTTSLSYNFMKQVPDAWDLRDSKGNFIIESDYPSIRILNLSSYTPAVGGQTYTSFLTNWLTQTVFPSGMWDGIFFDNLFARTNSHIVNNYNPSLFDVDWNLNGTRDETPNSTNEMARAGVKNILGTLRDNIGDSQLIVGNTGQMPDLATAPYINGYTFECVNSEWYYPGNASPSPAGWRAILSAYLMAQQNTRSPHLNIVEGCSNDGLTASALDGKVNGTHVTPTAADIVLQRFVLGTTLLGNGFYQFDLVNNLSAPYWYDEFSVNSAGTAIKNPIYKGYLGQALSDATELVGSPSLVLNDNFESGSSTAFSVSAANGSSISNASGDVISGNYSLVLSNSNYTQQGNISITTQSGVLQANAGDTFLVSFDWRVIQSLAPYALQVGVNGTGSSDGYTENNAVVAGDTGTLNFPVTSITGGPWSVYINLNNGGRIAIDNFRVIKNAIGPWRRDFESGLVLVNPLPTAHTFSDVDIAGALNRTKVRRILGTQAPSTNNGAAVSGGLTLQPFDAIILLADKIPASAPLVTPQTGWWWNPNDVAGRGYSIEVNNGRIFLAAYMYRDDGTPVWYIADETYTAPGFSGTLFDVNGTQTLNATGAGTTAIGPTSLKISGTFTSSTQGSLTLTGGPLGSNSKAIPITRFPIDSVSVKAPSSASAPQTGWWYNAQELGVGYFIEQQANQIFMANYLYGTDQRDRWYITLNSALPNGSSGETMTGSLLQVTGGQTLTSGPLAAVASTVGQVTVQFTSPTSGTVTLPSGRVVPITRFSTF